MERRHRKRLGGALATVVVVGTLLAVSSVAFGGVHLVVTQGTSMQPRIRTGDVVAVRETGDYRVGDVVAHRDTRGATVLHRIVERHGSSLTLRGDSNGWTDPHPVHVSDVVGEEWVHVPAGGRALALLRGPLPASLSIVALGMMVTRTSNAPSGRRRRSLRAKVRARTSRRAAAPRHAPDALPAPVRGVSVATPPPYRPPTSPTAPDPGSVRQMTRPARHLPNGTAPNGTAPNRTAPNRTAQRYRVTRGALLVAVAVLALAAALAGVSSTRPQSVAHPVQRAYRLHGELSYRAPAPAGPVYESEQLTTGDPVFLNLTDELEVRATSRVSPGPLEQVRGELALHVELAAGNGWSRTYPLGRPVELTGGNTDASATLDLRALQWVVGTVERSTGVHAATYRVGLLSTVSIEARGGGRPVREELTTRYDLQLDDHQLRPVGEATKGYGGAATSERSGSVTTTAERPAELSILGVSAPVGSVRSASTAIAGAAALACVGLWIALRRAAPAGEAERIVARHRRRIVEVEDGPERDGRAVIDVASMDALLQLADHDDLLVLHHHGVDADSFHVESGETRYRYTARR